jgi:2,3-bisphosphoglycerate-dependent phosphoglycerate mutase
VFTSDLRRAVETVEIAFAGSAVPVIADARLRECDYGSMNGMPRAELDALRRSKIDEPWPGGESWREAVERVEGFLQQLRDTRAGERVLVVGHVATRWALDHFANGIALEALVDEPFAWQEGWEYHLQ